MEVWSMERLLLKERLIKRGATLGLENATVTQEDLRDLIGALKYVVFVVMLLL